MSAQPVDVLAVFAKLMVFGGMFEPRAIIPQNPAFGTSTIRSHTNAKSPAVRRALEAQARAGLVQQVPNPCPGWNDSAAERAEHHWQLTDAGREAVARVGGAAALARVSGGAA